MNKSDRYITLTGLGIPGVQEIILFNDGRIGIVTDPWYFFEYNNLSEFIEKTPDILKNYLHKKHPNFPHTLSLYEKLEFYYKELMKTKQKEKKMSNRTRIHYHIFEDMVYIDKIENALSFDELRNKYGKDIADAYFSHYPCFRKQETRLEIREKNSNWTSFSVDGKLRKERFGEIINDMKEAGDRLVELIQKRKKTETKIIEI